MQASLPVAVAVAGDDLNFTVGQLVEGRRRRTKADQVRVRSRNSFHFISSFSVQLLALSSVQSWLTRCSLLLGELLGE